ncbi:MAG TPA: endonuclease MutS2 [bacterium]|jgi:DNA mismatch repair protein MutS2
MIFEETLHTLEFDRVRKIAAGLCASALGSDRLAALLPFSDVGDAELCLMRTGQMVTILSATEFPIFGLTDIREELRAASISGAALDPESLLRVAECAAVSVAVKAFLGARRQTSPLLFEMVRDLADLKKLAQDIQSAIDADGTIKDDASPGLKRIRQTIRSETKALEGKLNGILQKWADRGYLQDSIISYREGRLALPVKDEMRNRVQGVIVDQSASGATVFMEPVETLEVSNRLRQLELEERREIHRIMLDLTSRVHSHLDEFWQVMNAMADLDEYYGRARLALRWDGVDAAFSERGAVRILRGRHPLLLERLKSNVIPLTMEMQPPLRTFVISGPNAGGKTVVLKTVGLFCMMAAAGLFIPASPGCELPFFAGIHADIGDAQSIESDLSTFTAHVARLKRMVEDESRPKLILIDEIGSSTDPALGAALAQAVLLELVKQEAITLVTTHHGSLKAFAHETDGIENGSMSFDENSLVPTYTFRAGLPGSSYALEIAERVGFPHHLLEAARAFAGTGMLGLEQLVSELSRKIEDYEKLRQQSDLKLTEYGALQKLYQERTNQLKKIQAEAKARAVAEADAMIAKAGRDMDAAIKEIKKQSASKETVKAARETIMTVREEVEKTRRETEKILEPEKPERIPLDTVRVGDRVEIEDLQGVGRVLAIQKNGKRVDIEIGGARLTVDVKRLYAAPVEAKRGAPRVKMDFTLDTAYVNDQLDLRGKYGEEAIPEIDSYLAAAVEARLKTVTLIHGKGTGALRTKVHTFLNTHPLVRSYHDGGRDSMDFGSTVVELT